MKLNDFGCMHSKLLRVYFDIENRGIDYINNFGVRFEFKESHAKDFTKMFFKVPRHQLANSDYIVFCVYHNEFFIHKSKLILNRYSFDNEKEHCCLRYTTIRKNSFRKFTNYENLKLFVEKCRGVK